MDIDTHCSSLLSAFIRYDSQTTRTASHVDLACDFSSTVRPSPGLRKNRKRPLFCRRHEVEAVDCVVCACVEHMNARVAQDTRVVLRDARIGSYALIPLSGTGFAEDSEEKVGLFPPDS